MCGFGDKVRCINPIQIVGSGSQDTATGRTDGQSLHRHAYDSSFKTQLPRRISTLGPCLLCLIVLPCLSAPRDIEGIRSLSNKVYSYSEVDTAFFVLTVDLWSADGKREVNLVRHSATSPSISAATSSSYPPRPPTPPYQPNGSSAPNSAHPFSMQHQQWNHGHQLPPQQSPTQPAHPAQYGFGVGNSNYHLYRTPQPLPPPPQPQYQQAQPQYHPHQQYPPQHQQQAYYTAPSANGMAYYTQQPPAQGPLLTPDQMQPQGGQQPAGMFTRNLIGSLCVSAFKLTDCDAQTGVWFILQDLSVRTEGTFRYAHLDHSPHAPNLARVLLRDTRDLSFSYQSQNQLPTVLVFAVSPVSHSLLTPFAAD